MALSKFKQHDSFQLSFLPCSAGFGLPNDHPVRFFTQFFEDEIDFSKVLNSIKGNALVGRPAYHPVMMVKLLMYGYAQGISSSRELAKACVERLDFRFITGNQMPDHRSIARFRKMHLEALEELFQQSIELAAAEELIEMKEVAVDGSKILANASKRKAMSYSRMIDTSKQLKAEIYILKQEAHVAIGRKQVELKQDLRFKRKKLNTIRTAKKKLEEKAKSKGKRKPEDKSQINFTDSESAIMRVGSGFEQCYNAQVVVDKNNQIVVAAKVTQDGNDKLQIGPMLDEMILAVGLIPNRVLADSGYFSDSNVSGLLLKFPKLELFIPPNRNESSKELKRVGRIPADMSTIDRMRRKLSSKGGKAVYKFRKAIVEPVFGQIKSANLKFARFSFRGFKAVSSEWKFVCAIHNFWKIQRARAKKVKLSSIAQAA